MPLDLELVNQSRFKPEPPSEIESEGMSQLDPVDYAVYTQKLEVACRESREVLKRLGISTFIKAGDTAHGIYTANGDLSIADVGTYLHVVDGIIPIKFVLKHYANDSTVGLNDGDIFFCNEAIYGGIHNPDMITFLPVFFGGKLVAWVAAAAHETETGATEPGGMPNTAKTRYDEGLKVPPIKIGENFTLKKDILELFENNVRYPLMISNDQYARLAACLRLRKRILEIVEKKGADFLVGLLRRIILNTEHAVSERVKQIPDGRFRHVAFLDVVGPTEGLLRLPVTMIKKGDQISFDLRGASPQVDGSFNSFEHMVEAHLASNIFQYLLNDLPASSGCLIPFKFITTKGSCLNADPQAAISNVTLFVPYVINAIQICLIKALYSLESFRRDENIALPLGRVGGGVTISGKNQWNSHVTTTLITLGNSSGAGARYDKDGVDSLGFWFAGYAEAVDCEQDESVLPMTTLWRGYMLDGGGPGKFRGGTGISFGYLITNTDKLAVKTSGSGHRFPVAQGVFGGYPADTSAVLVCKQAKSSMESRSRMPRNALDFVENSSGSTKLSIMRNSIPLTLLSEGDLIASTSGGGGGYGDVLDRDPEMVVNDIATGKISEWAAREVYKVVFDSATLKVDLAATKDQRTRERKKRVERGRSFREFARDWEKKRPPDKALGFYGEWPLSMLTA